MITTVKITDRPAQVDKEHGMLVISATEDSKFWDIAYYIRKQLNPEVFDTLQQTSFGNPVPYTGHEVMQMIDNSQVTVIVMTQEAYVLYKPHFDRPRVPHTLED